MTNLRTPSFFFFCLFLVIMMLASIRSWKNAIVPRHYIVSRHSLSMSSRMPMSRSRDRFSSRGGGGGGGRGGYRPTSDPFAALSFKKTIKIDPDFRTPVQDMNLSEITKEALAKKGFTELTPVQSQSYDQVFNGDDVVARSRTGTGKTFAFGIPLIEKLVATGEAKRRSEREGLPLVLVLEPTRELAVQVAQELATICKPHRMRVTAVYGGSSYSVQESIFREGVHIIVTTPGRMLDHIRSGSVDLSHVKHVVLDEGDTMLEMGFQQDVESILMSVKAPGDDARKAAAKALKAHSRDEDDDFFDDDVVVSKKAPVATVDRNDKVQMLLYSATMPAWICSLTDKLMKDPVFLDAVQEGETRLASTITHYGLPLLVSGRNRIKTVSSLIEDLILTKGAGGQTIIFTNTKEDADLLVTSGCFGRLTSQVLHGDIGQSMRQTTLRQFKDGSIDVLVATDVAARGLDIAGVELVIHTALPNDPDSYVHRSGRTGRAGRSGTSIALYTNEEERKMRMFEKQLNFKFMKMGAPTEKEISEASTNYAVQKLSKVDDDVIRHFAPYASTVIEKALKGELIAAEDAVVEEEDTEGAGSEILKHLQKTTTDLSERQVMENLVARCVAVISNRQAFLSRSLLTGEEGTTTLQIEAHGPYTPETVAIPIWQR